MLSPKIINCNITNNEYDGISCYSEQGRETIINCNISNNGGYGIYSFEHSPIIKNCTLYNNFDFYITSDSHIYALNTTFKNSPIEVDSSSSFYGQNTDDHTYLYGHIDLDIEIHETNHYMSWYNTGLLYFLDIVDGGSLTLDATLFNLSCTNFAEHIIRIEPGSWFNLTNNACVTSYPEAFMLYFHPDGHGRLQNSTIANCGSIDHLLGGFRIASDDVIIDNCTIRDCGAIYCIDSSPIIKNSDIVSNEYGIIAENSAPTIYSNTISLNSAGIISENSAPTIYNNTISLNSAGIISENSVLNISQNTIKDNRDGIVLYVSTGVIVDNHITGMGPYRDGFMPAYIYLQRYGIYAVGSNCTISHNDIDGNFYGIYYKDSDNGTISYNNISDHAYLVNMDAYPGLKFYTYDGVGVWLNNSDILVEQNNFTDNLYGIEIEDSSPSIRENNIYWQNNMYHVFDWRLHVIGPNGTLIPGEWHEVYMQLGTGLYGYGTPEEVLNISVLDNDFLTNRNDIYLVYATGEIDGNNITIDDPRRIPLNLKPRDGIVCGFCENMSIRKNDISEREKGIYLGYCGNNTILENEMSNNKYGIYMEESPNNTIINNNVTDNRHGIMLRDANATIEYNNISSNNDAGIYLFSSSSTTISGNTLWNNLYGLQLVSSTDNLIYYNNFIDNTYHAYDDGINTWNLTYPSGGTAYYEHDAVGRMTSAKAPSGRAATYEYDAAGNRTVSVWGNSACTYYSFDAVGRTERIRHLDSGGSALAYFDYSRDARGDITKIARLAGLTTYYDYDSVGRLTYEDWKEANGTSLYAFSYDYDLNGNRTSGSILGVATYWSYNEADALATRWTEPGPSPGLRG